MSSTCPKTENLFEYACGFYWAWAIYERRKEIGMDSFEDFEFKPLTEGLGFHKKTGNSDSGIKASQSASSKKEPPKFTNFDLPEVKAIPNFENAYEKSMHDIETLETDILGKNQSGKKTQELPLEVSSMSQSLFTQKPLPREGEVREKKKTLQIPKFQGPKFTKSFNDKPVTPSSSLSFYEDKSLEAKTTTPISNKIDTEIHYKYTEAQPSMLSIFLDSTVIAGLAILFALALVVATKIDIVKVMSTKMDLGTQVGIFLLAYSVSQLYYILARVFFGQTLGEWSLEHQLGLKEDQKNVSYVFKLILRTFVLTVTGFVLLPIISQFTKSDVSGRISGLRMYRQDQV